MAKEISKRTLKEGAKIRVQTRDRGIVNGTVDFYDSDGKNGEPAIDWSDEKGETWWCYKDQIVEVL